MRRQARATLVALLAGVGVILVLLGYLLVFPPDLFRVGTNYSAKTVCSNVFLADRDAEEVLAVDVQAPGHPLLRHISISVDKDARTVDASLFGFLAKAQSQYRDGLGCTNLQGGALSARSLHPLAPIWEGSWPNGAEGAASLRPEVQNLLEDDTLVGPGFRAVIAVHKGEIVAERYGADFDAQTPLLGWSMTKTVTAVLIGTLIKEGKLALEDDLTTSFTDWQGDERRSVSLADMLAMDSGLEWNEDYGDVSDVTRMLFLEKDMAGFAAGRELGAQPGGTFNYSSGTSTMLSRFWQDQLGTEALAYPQTALFAPLGMVSAVMETDPKDTFVGSSYMYATAQDWARFGQFLLAGGRWNNQQILPAGFVDWMFEPTGPSQGVYAKGHLWIEPPGDLPPFEDAVWIQGHDGQSIGVFPSHDLVLVRLGLTPSKLGYSPLPLAQEIIRQLQ